LAPIGDPTPVANLLTSSISWASLWVRSRLGAETQLSPRSSGVGCRDCSIRALSARVRALGQIANRDWFVAILLLMA
jgi:hypothetical protein